MASGVGAAAGLADAGPVGGPVAGSPEAQRVHHGFQQHGPGAVALLPVRRQLLDGQRQRVRGQMLDPHPRKQQVARLPHHQVQVLLVGPRGPADPGVAAGQRVGRLAEQQAAQRPPLPVQQEVAQVRAHRLTVAEVMVPLDVLVPQPGLLLLLDQLQAQRLQLPQTRLDPRLGSAAPGRDHRLARSATHVLGALGGQPQDAGLLELLQQAQRGLDPVAAGRRVPVEVLADRLRQFLAAQGREGGDHLLNLGDLPTGEAPTEEGGRLELFDQGIHERICTPASYHRKSGLGCQGVFTESSKKTVSVSESAYWRILRKPRFRLA